MNSKCFISSHKSHLLSSPYLLLLLPPVFLLFPVFCAIDAPQPLCTFPCITTWVHLGPSVFVFVLVVLLHTPCFTTWVHLSPSVMTFSTFHPFSVSLPHRPLLFSPFFKKFLAQFNSDFFFHTSIVLCTGFTFTHATSYSFSCHESVYNTFCKQNNVFKLVLYLSKLYVSWFMISIKSRVEKFSQKVESSNIE